MNKTWVPCPKGPRMLMREQGTIVIFSMQPCTKSDLSAHANLLDLSNCQAISLY